jgi:hypothetical protein
MICNACKGVGYHVTHNRTNYKDKDEWGVKYFLGERYRFKLCKKCMGIGEILTHYDLNGRIIYDC